jgi:hypothetical protein
MTDTCGAVSIASRHLLTNIMPAKKRGNPHCRMVTVNGITPPCNDQGELHFEDETGLPVVILCYAQADPILGYKDFVLISNSTLVDIECDINYHAKSSKLIGAVQLRRTSSEPFHYADYHTSIPLTKQEAEPFAATWEQQTQPTNNSGCTCQPRLAPQLTEVEYLRITGRKLRKPPRGRINPKKDRARIKATHIKCFMTEIQLQQLLQRTSSSNQDEEGMDMTVKDGIKMSKYDIRVVKIGTKVSP